MRRTLSPGSWSLPPKLLRSRAKRRASGTPAGRNSVGYAADVTSTVRLWYEARRSGPVGLRSQGGQNCPRFRAVRKALAKSQPQPRPARRPVLPHHMRRLRAVLRLDTHVDHTFWCLALSCWVGVRRVGDWFVDEADAAGPWVPASRSHHGRISVSARAGGGSVVVVEMKPPKEDPSARRSTAWSSRPSHAKTSSARGARGGTCSRRT